VLQGFHKGRTTKEKHRRNKRRKKTDGLKAKRNKEKSKKLGAVL
jgi:hypothetical protein